jgi:aminoglycoside phosphotransferase (APT) family kinase protein
VLLRGGRITPGVVRVGATVRRPPTPNSDFVRRLLRHLESAEFEGAPRALGTDDQGRDVFSYVEGDVPPDLAWHEDPVLVAAARLIRRYHDVTEALVASPAAYAAGLEVVCHNDLSPCNFVFRSGLPVALIDFDTAAPGTRRYDIGYAIWGWLDLGTPEIEAAEQRRRLALFLDAYGRGLDQAEVIAATLERQRVIIAQGERTGNHAMAKWAAGCLAWTRQHLGIKPERS